VRISKRVLLLSVVICLSVLVSQALADVALPKPKTSGGDGVFDLIERRASGTRNNFPTGEISLEDLSTILWAATGRNRGDSGWTVPMAGGLPPYVKVYVVKRDGVFVYDWKEHALVEISKKNAMADITGDNFVKASAAVLVLVSDPSGLGSMARSNSNNSLSYIATGAISQNVYLASDALGISTRYLISMNAGGISRELKLKKDETPLCIMPLGHR
jgi:hypothetical protein